MSNKRIISAVVAIVTLFGISAPALACDDVSKITDPMGNSEHYTYDLQGNTVTKTDRNGVTASYTYDIFGMTSETLPEEQPLYYTYVPK